MTKNCLKALFLLTLFLWPAAPSFAMTMVKNFKETLYFKRLQHPLREINNRKVAKYHSLKKNQPESQALLKEIERGLHIIAEANHLTSFERRKLLLKTTGLGLSRDNYFYRRLFMNQFVLVYNPASGEYFFEDALKVELNEHNYVEVESFESLATE